MSEVLLLLIIAGLAWYIWAQRKKPAEITIRITSDMSASSSSEDAQPIDKDAWDPNPDDSYVPSGKRRPIKGMRLHIRFQDLEGKVTERDISPNWYVHDPLTGKGMVHAFCHLRGANRPFALSRIRAATDLETGEIIPNLGAHLDQLHQKSPAGAVDALMDEHSAAAYVLFCFAKADGALRAKERAIITSWASALGTADPTHLAELEKQMKGWVATDGGFWDAVKTVVKEGKGDQYTTDLWTAVTAIVQSDKTPSEQEIKYLRYAADRLKQRMPDGITAR